MIIRNFYDTKLAQASYLIGCAATGEAIIVDPLRDIAQYIAMADSLGLHISAVTETHIHADFLSGTRELSAATGATMYLSDEGGVDWTYSFGNDPKVVLMKHGYRIVVGNLSLIALHTPGHTPEHMSYLLTDHPAGETPHSLFSGDFIFVGDVGRPDLLERAANMAGTMEKGARILHQSLQKLSDLPDSLLVWPAHGAGSACGKSLGGSPVTSLGYERRTNWAFQIDSEDRFVDEVLSGQPEPPVYFKMMKHLNKVGPAVLGSLPNVARTTNVVGRLIDARPPQVVREGAYEGATVLPVGKAFTNWSGWLLAYDEPVTLIALSQEDANTAARDMATIGLDVVSGWVHPDDLGSRKTSPIEAIDATEIKPDDFVLDVRGINERRAERLDGTCHIPLGELSKRTDELPKSGRLVVYCASAGRTPTAISLLRQQGFTNVVEIRGGLGQVRATTPELVHN